MLVMIERFFRINRKNIAPVQFIVEGYEGMATVSTIDPHQAIIKISIMPGFFDHISGLISELEYIYGIEPVEDIKKVTSLC